MKIYQGKYTLSLPQQGLAHQLYYRWGEHSSGSVSLQCTDNKKTKLLWLQLMHIQASGIYLAETQTTQYWHNQWQREKVY